MILFAFYHLVLNQFGGYCIQVISLPIHVQYSTAWWGALRHICYGINLRINHTSSPMLDDRACDVFLCVYDIYGLGSGPLCHTVLCVGKGSGVSLSKRGEHTRTVQACTVHKQVDTQNERHTNTHHTNTQSTTPIPAGPAKRTFI